MKKGKYKQYSYSEIQQKLLRIEDIGIGNVLPELGELLRQTRVMNWKMQKTLNDIAAYHDKEANEHLKIHGSFSAFDEPRSVQLARELLQEL